MVSHYVFSLELYGSIYKMRSFTTTCMQMFHRIVSLSADSNEMHSSVTF